MRPMCIALAVGMLPGLIHATASAQSTDDARLYWTDVAGPGRITRAELDGSSVTDVLTLSGQGGGLSIDPFNDKMYWTQYEDNSRIRRANLDGTNAETVIDLSATSTLGVNCNFFSLDPIGQKLYWRLVTINDTETIIGRANLDGTNMETIATLNAGGSGSLAVDPFGEKIYWTTQQYGAFGFTSVRRMDFDGSSIEVIASGRRYTDIQVDPIHQKVYWVTVDTGDRRIQRADLDGSNLEDIIPDTLDFSEFSEYVHLPRSISVDPIEHRIYWINNQFRDDRLMSADLDGTNVSQLFLSPRSSLNQITINRALISETHTHDSYTTDVSGSSSLADLTNNGFVDFEDLTILLANWNQDVSAAFGDIAPPNDAPVDFGDLTFLLAEWTGPGTTGSTETTSGTGAVPEPSTLLLALFAALGLSFYRRRRRRAF